MPTDLRVPGAVYCDNADCTGFSIANGPGSSAASNLSTGRIDPPWVQSYGWQGFLGQNRFLEFGKKPFAPRARTAASAVTWCMPRRGRLTIRRCSSN